MVCTAGVPDGGPANTRYLRLRRRLRLNEGGPLWVGTGGRSFGYYALRLTLQNRAKKAGIAGSEAGLMAVAGWSDRAMLDRYTSASASERATAEARRLGLGISDPLGCVHEYTLQLLTIRDRECADAHVCTNTLAALDLSGCGLHLRTCVHAQMCTRATNCPPALDR
jgi:hypothetical protein